jgi:predicted Zn-dependent protease with MMP-like domain
LSGFLVEKRPIWTRPVPTGRGSSNAGTERGSHSLLPGLHIYWEAARKTANRALRENLWCAEASFVRGAIRERGGDYSGAHRDFLRAWRTDPNSWPMPAHREDGEVEKMIETAVAKLHPSICEYMENVAVILEDLPNNEVLWSYDPPASPTALLGYFSGYTMMESSTEVPWSTLPPAMVIYRRNIERMAADTEEIVEQLRITILHEVGQALGLDEAVFEYHDKDLKEE